MTMSVISGSTAVTVTTASSTQPKPVTKTYGKIILTLENCLLPDVKLDPTPSQLDGLDRETEIDLRVLGCELIQTAGILLKLPQVAMATGQVLFQRFFYSKSFVRHSMETTAMSCICLASKIEEAPRRIRDVINVFHHIKQVRAQKEINSLVIDQNYITLKMQIIKAERRVLKELGFCVHIKHPHKLIVMYLQVLGYEKQQKLMQIAWNFMNDSLRTDVFLRYQPETIACACVYLTARKLGIPLPNNPSWYGIFKVSEDHIVDVCYRIMALYKRQKPNVEKLEEAVEELKTKYWESKNKAKAAAGQNTPPATVTVIDRSNGGGTHNAWGGFISRSIPVANEAASVAATVTAATAAAASKENPSKRSYSKSRSRSPSADNKNAHSRSSKKSRHRSRSQPPNNKSSKSSKKNRNYSPRSGSGSPSLPPPQSGNGSSQSNQLYSKSKSKNNDDRDKEHYTNGGSRRNSRDRHRDRDNDRSARDHKGNKDYSNKGSHRSSKHSRDRDRDRKR